MRESCGDGEVLGVGGGVWAATVAVFEDAFAGLEVKERVAVDYVGKGLVDDWKG